MEAATYFTDSTMSMELVWLEYSLAVAMQAVTDSSLICAFIICSTAAPCMQNCCRTIPWQPTTYYAYDDVQLTKPYWSVQMQPFARTRLDLGPCSRVCTSANTHTTSCDSNGCCTPAGSPSTVQVACKASSCVGMVQV
jgi:hypothetical protein